jgi:hypothetical protein
MASVRLTAGTKEIVPVDVTDSTGVTTDLSAATPLYTVLNDAEVAKYTDASTTASGMRIKPMIDTSSTHAGGAWAVGHYRLFVKFTVATEIVKLGPIDLYVVST